MTQIPAAAPDSSDVTIESLFLRSASTAPRLRIGLLFSPGKLRAPASQIIQKLRDADFVELIATIIVEAAVPAAVPTEPVLYRAYRRWNELTHATAARSLAPSDCAAMLDTAVRCCLKSDPNGGRLVLSPAQHAELTACRLDVILALGRVPLPSELANMARFGVWINRIGDPAFGDREPRQFWNTLRRTAPLSVSLQAHTAERREPITLASATSQRESGVSTISNLIGPVLMAGGLIQSTLWQLHSMGWDYVLAHSPDAGSQATASDSLPTNWQMLRWFPPRVVAQLRHRFRLRNTSELWRVGVRRGSPLEGLAAACTMTDLSWLAAPAGHYYSDPFAVVHLGRCYLFVEDFDIAANKGRIACLELDHGTAAGPAQIVLERPYHLSYPQVLVHGGEIFMIPESGYNHSVEIYRAVSFPARWELIRVLFRGPAFDTTLLQHAGLFWFLVTLSDGRNPQRIELVLFYSSDLLGEWTLHPASPISKDIRVSRCAGSPFLDAGSWIRPAQDGSVTYGGALRFQRIVQIDRLRYVEEAAGSVAGDMIPGATGVHTYNRVGDLEVVDAKWRVHLRAGQAAAESNRR